MERCEKYPEWVSAYIDGELSADEQAELRRHLEACPACKRVLMVYRTMSLTLSDTEIAPPAGFADGVMARIESKPLCVAYTRPRRPMLRRTLAAAAVFALVAAVGFAAVWENIGGAGNEAARFGIADFASPQAAEALQAETAWDDSEGDILRGQSADTDTEWSAEEEIPSAEIDTVVGMQGSFAVGGAAPEEADIALFDLAMAGEYQSWPELAAALDAAGYTYVPQGDGFRVADPYNPGSYLHARVPDDPALAEEYLLLTFSFQWEDEERTVHIHVQDGEMTYYYGAPVGDTGLGTPARSLRRLREFILFGER